jgi:hypothetical protein
MHDDNWYQPSAAPPETWSASRRPAGRPRPTSWLILGVLSIIWGIGGLVCVPFGTFLEFVPREGAEQANVHALVNGITQHNATYRSTAIVIGGLEFIASALLAVGGIGLVSSENWAYWLVRIYAISSLILAFVSVAAQIVLLVIPVVSSVPAQDKGYAIGSASVTTIGAVLGAIFPLVLLVAVAPSRGNRDSRSLDQAADPWSPNRDFR